MAAWTDLFKYLDDFLENLFKGLGDLSKNISSNVSQGVNSAVNAGKQAAQDLNNYVEDTVIPGAKDAASGAVNAGKQATQEATEATKSLDFSNLGQKLSESLAGLSNLNFDFSGLKNIGESVSSGISNAVDTGKDIVGDAINTGKGMAQDLNNYVEDTVAPGVKDAVDTGKQVVSNVVDTGEKIVDGVKGAVDAVGNVVDATPDILKGTAEDFGAAAQGEYGKESLSATAPSTTPDTTTPPTTMPEGADTNVPGTDPAPTPEGTDTNVPGTDPTPTPEGTDTNVPGTEPAPTPEGTDTNVPGTDPAPTPEGTEDPYADINQRYQTAIDTSNAGYDAAIGTLDENYQKNTDQLLENYQKQQVELDRSRVDTRRTAAISQERLMKYLPTMLKRQGLAGLGVSQTAAVSAQSNYANTLANVEEAHRKGSAELLEGYNESKLGYDTEYNTNKTKLESDKLVEQTKLILARDEEIAKKGDASAAALEARQNENFKAISDMISTSSATDFTSVLESIKGIVSEDQYLILQQLATDQAAKNTKTETDKTETETKATQDQNFALAYDYILNDTTTTDFDEYLDTLEGKVSDDQLAHLRTIAEAQAKINSVGEVEKANVLTKEEQNSCYNAAAAIIEASTSTDFTDILAKFKPLVSDSQYALLEALAAEVAKKNTKTETDKTESETKATQEANYTDAWNLILNDSTTTDESGFSTYLSGLEDKLTPEQYNNLLLLAKQQAAKNKAVADGVSDATDAAGRDENYTAAWSIISSNTTATDKSEFDSYIATLEGLVSASQLAQLKVLIDTVVANNKAVAEGKEADQATAEQNAAYNDAWNLILNDTTKTTFEEFSEYLDGVKDSLTDRQYANLVELAKQIAANNSQKLSDKETERTEEQQSESFSSAWSIIAGNTVFTDASQFTPLLESYQGLVSEAHYTDLLNLASTTAANNKKKADDAVDLDKKSEGAEVVAEFLAKLDVFDVEGDYEGALDFLESNKDKIPDELYDVLITYFEAREKNGPGKDSDNEDPKSPYESPYANQQGSEYEYLTEEEKTDRINTGKDYLYFNGGNYKIIERLSDDSNYLTNNSSTEAAIKSYGYSGLYDLSIPNGFTIPIIAAKDGSWNSLKEEWWEFLEFIGAYDPEIKAGFYPKTVYLTWFDGSWQISEYMGSTLDNYSGSPQLPPSTGSPYSTPGPYSSGSSTPVLDAMGITGTGSSDNLSKYNDNGGSGKGTGITKPDNK